MYCGASKMEMLANVYVHESREKVFQVAAILPVVLTMNADAVYGSHKVICHCSLLHILQTCNCLCKSMQ